MADNYLIQILLDAKDNASAKIRALQREVAELKAQSAGEDLSAGLGDMADEADRAAQSHKDLTQKQREHQQTTRQSESDLKRQGKALQEGADAADQHAESIGQINEQHKEMQKEAPRTEESVSRVSKAHAQGAKSAAANAAAHSDLGAGIRDSTKSTEEFTDAQKKATEQGDQYLTRLKSLDQAARSHTATNKELETGYQQVASSLKSVWREFEIGSTEAEKFGKAMEDASKKANNTDLARASSGVGEMAQKFSQATDDIGIKVVSLSAQLRGLRLVGLVGLLQPLLTGLVSLAGGLFSVGAGATQAAATLGGVFISSLGQLIPMVGVAVAALERLKSVFQAVQAAQQEKQQNAFQPNQGLITQLQNTNQLIESEQNLKNAYYGLQDAQVQVKESQMQLTQARIDAIRNLQDLVLAEKTAELQSKQSNLAVTQAEQSLRAAQASGSQQGIEQAQLALQGARIQQTQAREGVPRSRQDLSIARGQGINGSPGVLSASESARQARLAVTQQQQAISEAQRQMKITELTAAQPASSETQAQGTLNYLLGQMSAPEKALFNSLNSLENQLRSPSSPLRKITDYIIEPFTSAFGKLDSLLSKKSFMGPITDMAKSMGKGIQSIVNSALGKRGSSFLDTMADDASKSIPVITKAITGLMGVFEDLAKSAAPAMLTLSRDWSKFWDDLDARERTPQGQARLEEFFNKGAKWAEDFAHLGRSIGDLLMALGRDAAPQGMKSVTSLSDTVEKATGWVDKNGPKVTKFFSEAEQGLSILGGVLFNIGKTLLQVFSLTSLQAFASLLNGLVLPAARDFANALGFVVTNLMKLLNAIGPLKALLEGGLAGFFGLVALNKLIGTISKGTNVVHGFHDAWKALTSTDGSWFNKIGAAWDALTTRITKGKTAINDAKKAQNDFATTTATDTAAEATEESAVTTELSTQSALLTGESMSPGGVILPRGVGAAEAGAGAADVGEAGAVGSVGALGAAGLAVAPLGFALLLGQLLNPNGAPGPSRGRRDTGLASLLGNVGAQHYDYQTPQGAFRGIAPRTVVGNQETPTSNALKTLQSGLSGIASPTQLSTTQLQNLYTKAQQILNMPDITQTQRQGLILLTQQLNPTTVAVQKAANIWETTFSGIQSTTGNVLKQTATQMQTNMQNIATNFGPASSSVQAMNQYRGMFSAMWQNVLQNTSAAVRGTAKGLDAISKMLNSALKAMGQGGVSLGTGKGQINVNTSAGQSVVSGLLSGQLSAGGVMSPNAEGGWHHAQSGGRVIQVGEAGHDEVTLTTDPRYAPRQRGLLGQFLKSAPHLASGGFVPEPGANFSYGEEPQIAGALNKLAQYIHAIIYGISGYRSPAHSEAVGGFSNDPHTRGQAADIGVNSLLRSSASALSNALLARFGLWRPFDMAGQDPNELNHVQLLPAFGGPAVGGLTAPRSSGGGVGSAISSMATSAAGRLAAIMAPTVGGVKGAMGQVAQGAVNMVAQAANQMLGMSGGAGAFHMPNVNLSGSVERQVYQFMSAAGFNKIAVAGELGNAGQESSMDPNTAGGGFWQQISNFGSGTGGSLLNQMRRMLPQIIGLRSAMNAAKSPGDAAVIFEQGFEKAGIPALANRIAYANQAYAAGYASGGSIGRAPWGGRPVPVVAHEGERISNPSQWAEVARMAGTTTGGLDHHLGFDGTPKQHFLSGGNVTMGPGQGTTTGSGLQNLSSINNFLGSLTSNLYTMDLGSVTGSLGTITSLFQVIADGFKKIGQLGGSDTKKRLDQMNTLLENFADPNNTDSTLNVLAAAFQRFQNNVANMVTSMTYAARSVLTTGSGSLSTPSQSGATDSVTLRGAPLTASNIGQTGQAQADLLGEQSLASQSQYLQGQSKAVAQAISTVKSSIRSVQHSKLPKSERDQAIKSLESQYTNLQQQQEALVSSMNSTITQRFQQEQQYVQDTINQVSDVYQTQQSALQARQSGAQSLGNYSQLPSIDQALAQSSQAQIKALQPVLQSAKKIGDSDLVAQIQQQISQLQGTVAQSIAQMVQDRLSGVEQYFQTVQASQQSQQSIEQTLGNFGASAGIDQAIANTTVQHIQALQGVLAQAQSTGNQGLATQIEQEISQLQATVVQSVAQMIQDAMSGIQQQAQTDQARVQMQQTISQVMQADATTPGQFAAAGAVNLSALQFNQTSMQGQLSGYNGLLGQALASGNTGAVATITQTIDQLTAELAQNTSAIQDNTVQVVQETASFIQSRGQFQTGVYGGLSQIIQTIGQTTGFTDVGALKSLTSASNTSLTNTNSGLLQQLSTLGGGATGLASLLGNANTPQQFVSALSGANIGGIESGQDQTWINTFENLINNLEQNTNAIASNNEQLATLNGQLLQPTTWTSTAFSAFRFAIFSGMGNLLPQFQSALPAGSAPTIAPTFNPISGTNASPTIGTLNINHAPTTNLDPSVIGEQLAHEASNAL